METVLSFDDVLLLPQESNIESRDEISLDTGLGTRGLSLPIISANMDTVTGATMAFSMNKAGGIGALHRFNSIEEQVHMYLISESNPIVSVGVGEDFMDRVKALYDVGARHFCIDIAHGHHVLMLKAIKRIKNCFKSTQH